MYHPSNTYTKTQVPTTHDPGTQRSRYHKTTLRADGTKHELAELWLLCRGCCVVASAVVWLRLHDPAVGLCCVCFCLCLEVPYGAIHGYC